MDAKKEQTDNAQAAAQNGLKCRLKKTGEQAREKFLSATKALSQRPHKGAAKGEAARQKILAAARTVFSRYPYHAASIRMIAREGGFDHPLIHYYFPTKANLFEEVARLMYEEFQETQYLLQEGMEDAPPMKRLHFIIDRVLDHGFSNLETLGVLMQNVAQTGKIDEIPGYHYIPEVFAQVRKSFTSKFPAWITDEEADQLIYCFTCLLFVFVGTTCQAQVMGMDFASDEYRAWVRATLVSMFQPHLEKALARAGVPLEDSYTQSTSGGKSNSLG